MKRVESLLVPIIMGLMQFIIATSIIIKLLAIPIAIIYYLLLKNQYPSVISMSPPYISFPSFTATLFIVESPSRASPESISLLVSSLSSLAGKKFLFLTVIAENMGLHGRVFLMVASRGKIEPSLLLPLMKMRIGKVSVAGSAVSGIFPIKIKKVIIPPPGVEPELVESVLATLPPGWVVASTIYPDKRVSLVIGMNDIVDVPAGFEVRGGKEIPGDSMLGKGHDERMFYMVLGLASEKEGVEIVEEIMTGGWKEKAMAMLLSIPGAMEGKPVYVKGEEVMPSVIGRDFIALVSDDMEKIAAALPLLVEYAAISGRSRVIVVTNGMIKSMLSDMVAGGEAIIKIFGDDEIDILRDYLQETAKVQ